MPVLLAMYAVRILSLRIGLGAIAATAIGDDSPLERITSVTRRPSYFIAKDLDIPNILDDELKEEALRKSSKVLQGVYELQSGPFVTNVAELVRQCLTDPYIVHSQYYRHEELISLIATAISNNGNVARPAEVGSP